MHNDTPSKYFHMYFLKKQGPFPLKPYYTSHDREVNTAHKYHHRAHIPILFFIGAIQKHPFHLVAVALQSHSTCFSSSVFLVSMTLVFLKRIGQLLGRLFHRWVLHDVSSAAYSDCAFWGSSVTEVRQSSSWCIVSEGT